MREWTREERYRVLKSAEEIRGLHERIRKSVYRQTYHVQPVTGLSSDPNGFALHKGVWHLCYQWCPWGAVHGLKYWYHVTSTDLISWKNEGIGLAPDCYYDNRGTHSGSAISAGDELYFFYTGNHRDEDWTRTPYTCAAVLGSDGRPHKLEKPLFGPRATHSEHQRDPKIVWVESKQRYYIFIGAQTADLRGCVLVYESEELLSGWRFAGQLNVPGYERFGGMWECPYIVRIGGKDVLIFSPQYTKLPGRGNSTNHNVYFLGTMDYDTLTFTPDGPYRFLDFGFDFYAAQGAANVSGGDRAILIAWNGLPDNHYPTEEEDWEGTMTLPRELRVRDGRLVQTPISGVERLRCNERTPDGTLDAACELIAEVPEGDFDLNLFTKADGTGGLRLHYDAARKVCTVDRTGMDRRFNEQVFEVLDMPLETPLRTLRVFIDHCSTELFVNDGEATFTTRSYPTEREFHYTVSDGAKLRLWTLAPSVTDDFAL
ncbi:MAG: sucrose-6-phosphate hydrolase [Oscillospiraceae bacterium]|nr:sucrose-6-phosphate hydrolase [Oscillospiraceae bacterium]